MMFCLYYNHEVLQKYFDALPQVSYECHKSHLLFETGFVKNLMTERDFTIDFPKDSVISFLRIGAYNDIAKPDTIKLLHYQILQPYICN